MISEQRIVRPYAGADLIQQCLSGVRLCIGGEAVEPGQRLTFPPEPYLTSKVSVQLTDKDSDFESFRLAVCDGVSGAGYDLADLEILISTSSPRLKTSAVVFRCNLANIEDLTPTIGLTSESARPEAFQAPFGGCRVDLFVCLARELDVIPLRAWRRGTWLGRVFFRIETELGEIGFTPVPLDDEKRKLFSLSPDTLRFAHVDGPLDPEQGDNTIVLYVDQELLARLALAPMTKGAKAFQAQLFLDAMTALIYTASAEMNREPQEYGSISDIEGSICDRVLQRLAGKDSQAKEIFFEKTKTDPTLVVAHIEGLLPDLQKNLSSILSGVQS